MRCPFCRSDNDKVIDSRSADEGFSIRRRRECLDCQRRYTTYERLEALDFKVVKKDGTREPFDEEKLRHGVGKACWKRPVSPEQIDSIVAGIQTSLYGEFEKEIESSQLGELIMAELRKVDQVAYIRFASVYRAFTDAKDFVEEVVPMLRQSESSTD